MNNILLAPPSIPREKVQSQLAIKPGSQMASDLGEVMDSAEAISKPKAIYRISFIEARDLNTVTIEETTFHSPAMSENFTNISRVFPFIATCGIEIDEIPFGKDDILKQYWLNAIKQELLYTSLEYLRKTLKKYFRLDNLSAMNPGSGEVGVWPLEEQRLLFQLFGSNRTVEREIGVRLQPSYLMVPEMSVSGILFPSETKYYNCQLCQREGCPGRQAHFDPELWNSIHISD